MNIRRGNLLPALGALIWLAGCASVGPPMPPSLELPKAPSDLRAARKGDKVTLTWTVPQRTTDRQTVRYLGKTRICRTVESTLKQCGSVVGEATPPADFARSKSSSSGKLSGDLIDTLPSALGRDNPRGIATYAVEVLNTAGKSAGLSNQVHVPLLPTLQPFDPFAAQVQAQGVLVSWQCPPTARGIAGVKYLFRIYRRAESDSKDVKVADVEASECAADANASSNLHGAEAESPQEKHGSSFLDQTFEWEKTYFYKGAVVSVLAMSGKSSIEVEGDDTPEVKVFAHDVFPPAVPSGLQAVFSGPGQQPFIDLIWAPVSDADLDGYNVYRHEEAGAEVKLNSEPVKAPAFRDSQILPGKKYFYSVSAIDVRGNESARSAEAGESSEGGGT